MLGSVRRVMAGRWLAAGGWWVEQEVQRSHRCVLNPGGTLKIRPLQVSKDLT